jgi:hypothetical protein
MSAHGRLRLTLLAIRASCLVGFALMATASQAKDFSVPFAALQAWSNSITISLENVTIKGHSGVHRIKSDCEMHFGASVKGFEGDPPGWVLEPMNVCIEPFPGKKKRSDSDWLDFGDSLVGKSVTAIGVPRLWPEHLVGRSEPSNPNHAAELHPLTKLIVGKRTFDFSKLVYAPEGFDGGLSEATALKLLDPEQTEVTVARSGEDVEISLDAGRIGNFTTLTVTLLKDGLEELSDGYRVNGTVPLAKGKSQSVSVVAPAGTAGYTLVQEFRSSGRDKVRVNNALVLFSLSPKALIAAAQNGAGDVTVNNPIQFILYGAESE